MSLNQRALRGVVLAVGMLAGGSPAYSKVISLDVHTVPAVTDETLNLSVTATNHGDEPAFNVQVTVQGQGMEWSSPRREMLPVGQSYAVTTQQPLAAMTPGAYPLVIRVFYTDAKRYPFSAVSVAEVVRGSSDGSPSPLWALLTDAPLRQKGQLVLRMRNTAGDPQAVTVRLVLPQEFSAEPSQTAQTLQPGQESRLTFQLSNFSAREGSSYPVYALIESERQGRHQTAIAQAVVSVAAGASVKPFQSAFLAAATILFGVILGLNVRKGRRRA